MNGWSCPTCGRVWAPYVMECPGPHATFSTSSASTPHRPRGTTVTETDTTARDRMGDFARQWRIKRDADPSGLIYSIHFDGDAGPAELLVQDIEALCDGYDEAQDYRARWIAASDALAAARQALADLIGELRGQCDDPKQPGDAVWTDDLRAVIDRHDPEATS